MFMLGLILTTLQLILDVVAAPSPSSLCPKYFRYEKQIVDPSWVYPSNHNRLWRGVVTVPPTMPVFLKVELAVPGAISTEFVGRLELALNKTRVLENIKAGKLDEIKYYVYFPPKTPLPHILSVQVNSKIMCSAPPERKRVMTRITLEHSLYYPAVDTSSRFNFADILDPDDNTDQCGKSIKEVKNPLIIQGAAVSRGSWPWVVPLFKKTSMGLEFFCSGTLVSKHHIVTAAHCLRYRDQEDLPVTDIVAYVGRHDIGNWTELGNQPREVKAIYIHPDFDPHTLSSDLALLKLTQPVQINNFINCVCLWNDNSDLSLVVGHEAVALGWGKDGLGNKVSRVPRIAVMPIVSQEVCLRSKKDFLYLTSERTLCAGLRNGTGPCNGDSGGGLFLAKRTKAGASRWYLRGIISLSLLDTTTQSCDLKEFVIFTDVAKYQAWIKSVMSV